MQPEANPKVARSFAGPWLGSVSVAHLLAASLMVAMVPQRAMALGLGEEYAANVTVQAAGDDLPVGEDVGEPAEDAPVEGEPKAGEAPDLPAEDLSLSRAAHLGGGSWDGSGIRPSFTFLRSWGHPRLRDRPT